MNVSAAVRGETGFYFGNLRWLDGDKLLVELDGEIEPGERVDIRITLAPTAGTALVRARMQRTLVTARGETPRYVFVVDEVAASDQEALTVWLSNLRTRGTFSNFDTVVPAMRAADPMGQQSSSEVRLALERLARKPTSGSHPPLTDPFGARSDVQTGPSFGGGRGGIRDALRGAIARNTIGRPVATRAPGNPDGASAAGAPTGNTPGIAPPPRIAAPHVPATEPSLSVTTYPATDPTYASTQTRTARWLEVRWHSPAAFARACEQQLCNYTVVLQKGPEPLPDREPIRIMLRHEEVQIECPGTVKAIGTHGATYRIQLDALQIERLRQWALDYGRK